MEISENEMIEALKRSGYLLESEIAEKLMSSGFFVQTSQVIEDPITGKSRELDIIAECYKNNNHYPQYRSIAKIEYVFEVKNNTFPLVLMTKFQSNPNIEDWLGLKEAINLPDGLRYDSLESFYDKLVENKSNIYTQYCSFHKKKKTDELMASHPEPLHSGMAKIIQYCEEKVELMDTYCIYNKPEEEHVSQVFRHFMYMPVLLINDDLFELNDENLVKVESSILIVNYHFKGDQKMAYIFVVTKKGLDAFLSKTLKIESETAEKMAQIKINA